MSDDVALPLEFTEAAAKKVKFLIADEDNPNLKLRVYHRWWLQWFSVRLHL